MSYDAVIVGSCDHGVVMGSLGRYVPLFARKGRRSTLGGFVAVFTAGDLPSTRRRTPEFTEKRPTKKLPNFERLLARQMLPKPSQNDPQNL